MKPSVGYADQDSFRTFKEFDWTAIKSIMPNFAILVLSWIHVGIKNETKELVGLQNVLQ